MINILIWFTVGLLVAQLFCGCSRHGGPARERFHYDKS